MNDQFKKYFFCIVFFCLFRVFAFAQVPLPPIDSYTTIENGNGIVFVSISDSVSISEFEVNIGSKSEFTNLFTHNYIFDQTSGLPSGLTYIRTQLSVFLGVGTIILPSAYTVRVRIKNTVGNWSDWFEYTSN